MTDSIDATSRSDPGPAGDERGPAGHIGTDAETSGAVEVGRRDHGQWANRGVVPRGDKTVWVVVADEALARILRRRDEDDTLEDVEALADPAAHTREGEFQRDAAGRRAGSATHGAKQNSPHRIRGTASITASAGEEERHLEAQVFARRLAAHLAEALRASRFDELRLVAGPRFLGALRKELDPQVRATVAGELSKELIHEGNEALARRLFGEHAGESDG